MRVQFIQKYLLKIATNLNLKPEPEICPPRSGGWRESRRRGRVFSYLAAYFPGLVSVLFANRLFLSWWSFQDILTQPPLQGASLHKRT